MPYDFSKHLDRFGPRSLEHAPSYDESLAYCRELTASHYENFSVVSCLTPKSVRSHLCVVYAYCRWADDLSDEIEDAEQSLTLLDWWEELLDRCYANQPIQHPVFIALRRTVHAYEIPKQPFADLLSAFRQDQRQTRYEDIPELLNYCERSANPVGRIVLSLARCATEKRVRLSDQICTGLQPTPCPMLW